MSLTIFGAEVDAVDCASQLFGLERVDELSVVPVQALDPSILSVGHAQEVQLLSQGEGVGNVEGVGTPGDGDTRAVRNAFKRD